MGTIYTERMLVVVPVESLDTARTISGAVDKDTSGGLAFSVALSADGYEPSTHAWLDWRMTAAERKSLLALLALVKGANVYEGEKVDVDEVLADLGLVRVQESITLAKDAHPALGVK